VPPSQISRQITRAEADARALLLDVESYDIHLDFAADPDRVRSRSQIRFRCRQDAAATFAQVSALEVREITLNGTPLDPARVVADGRVSLDHLARSNLLVIEAEHGYGTDGQGFSRFTDALDGSGYALAWGYPTDAPSLFGCFDQPDLPAAITLSVSAPAEWVCVSHAAVEARPAEGAAGLWRFATMPSMKPQELTVFLGPYAVAGARAGDCAGRTPSTRILCRRSLAGSADVTRLAELAERAVSFYAGLFGIACPYDRLDLVFVPDLPPVALLVPALMGLNESLLHRISDADDDFGCMIVGHEIAHLWFGCLADCRWWDDVWLAEALATWASYMAGEEVLGMRSAWADFALSHEDGAQAADCLPTTQPVASAVDTAADALARPSAITYSKGASVVRQLGALIGERALREGLGAYLTRFAGIPATLDDVIGCCSQASGRDLSLWADEWLRRRGVNLLRPVLTLSPGGTIESLTVLQEPPEVDGASGTLRTHRIAIGLYDREGDVLRRRAAAPVEVSGPATAVGGLAGQRAPDAVILNDGDLTFARTRFDDRSLRSLADCALDVGDPVTEAVCWNAAWDMTTAAELPAADFAGLVARRIGAGELPVGLAELVRRAVIAAGYYALPADRPALRAAVAAACQARLELATVTGRDRRELARALAATAQTGEQIEVLQAMLAGDDPDLELRRQALLTLAAADRVSEEELDAFAAADPVGGELARAACHGARPRREAKERAWRAALAPGQAPRLAAAHAEGIWIPGQEDIALEWRDRYFSDALQALSGMALRPARRLGAALYPATIADRATMAATDQALARDDLSEAVRSVLTEQRELLRRVIAARATASGQPPGGLRAQVSRNFPEWPGQRP
jgi:aminopeptidase N